MTADQPAEHPEPVTVGSFATEGEAEVMTIPRDDSPLTPLLQRLISELRGDRRS